MKNDRIDFDITCCDEGTKITNRSDFDLSLYYLPKKKHSPRLIMHIESKTFVFTEEKIEITDRHYFKFKKSRNTEKKNDRRKKV